MSELKQILLPIGNPTNDGGTWNSGDVTEDRAVTAAELKDGSDATYEDLHGSGDQLAGPLGAINFFVPLETLTYGGGIDFVRWRFRTEYTEAPGSNRVFDTILGHKNTFRNGSVILSANTGFLNLSMDNALDPQTGLPWTKAVINAAQFGWRIDGEGDPNPCDGHVRVSEFWLEVWGPHGPTTPAGGPVSPYFREEIRQRTGVVIPDPEGT